MTSIRSNNWTHFVAILSLLFISSPFVTAAPRSAQELVQSGSWIYDAVTALAMESGTVNFADCSALSIEEIKTYLQEIEYDFLSAAGKTQYDMIMSYFANNTWSADCGIVSVGTEPEVNVEGQYKSNSDLDWIFDRYARKPFIAFPLTLSLGDWVSMYSGIHFAQNKGVMSHDDNYINIPLSADATDINFPWNTYFSTGHKFNENAGVAFKFGTNPRSVGRTLTGSCIMSDYLTGATYAELSFFSSNIKWTTEAVQLNVDRYYYSHRIDLRLFKKVSFSVLEGTLTNAPLELRYLNPFTIYHGFTPWRDYGSNDSHNCEIMAFKAEYSPVKYLRFYGLFVQDQWQTLYERTNWPDDETPNGLGGQLGTEAYIPAGDGYFHAALEGYYADPFLYIKQSPKWSYVRTYSENIGDMAVFYEWVGSPFGPDTVSGELTAGYEVPAKWSLNLTYLFICRGQYSDSSIFTKCGWGGTELDSDDSKWIYPIKGATGYIAQRDAVTPSGENPEYVNRISLRGTWHPASYLSVTLQPGYVFTYNNGHVAGETAQGFEAAVSISCKLCELHKINWDMNNKPTVRN